MNKEEAARILPFIQALAEGKELQYYYSSIDGWGASSNGINPFTHPLLTWRIKPETRWYRVALMNYLPGGYPSIAHNENEESMIGKDQNLLRWLTPRIEYEV